MKSKYFAYFFQICVSPLTAFQNSHLYIASANLFAISYKPQTQPEDIFK